MHSYLTKKMAELSQDVRKEPAYRFAIAVCYSLLQIATAQELRRV